MPENEILAEIHRTRAELSRRFGHDIHKLMAYYREQQEQSRAEGRQIVSFAKPRNAQPESVVREDAAEK